MFYVLAVLLGFLAGLRTMSALVVVSWAARFGLVDVGDTWLAFLGFAWTPWILTAFFAGELIADQLPTTPSRTVPIQLGARLVSGAVAGTAVGLTVGSWFLGTLIGFVGAVFGTWLGHAFRVKLAEAIGRDRPAALIEDLVTFGGVFVAALMVSFL